MQLRKRTRATVSQDTGETPSQDSRRQGESTTTRPINRRKAPSTSKKKALKEKIGQRETTIPEADHSLMVEVFQKCQHLQYHDECIKNLVQLYQSGLSHEQFCGELANLTKIILRSDFKNPYTKNCITFLPKLINTLDNDKKNFNADDTLDDLGESIFGEEAFSDGPRSKECVLDYMLSKLLIDETYSANTTVRQNTCSLILRLLHGITDIRKDIYNKLQKALLDRFLDRNFSVRTLAAYALRRFQDTSKKDDPVLTAYIFHLLKDPAFQVRLAVLQQIEVSPEYTLNFIIKKIRDVKAILRKQAFVKIADHVNFQDLSLDQRLMILKEGLNDRHPTVRKTVETRLLESWLKQCNNDIVALISKLNIITDPKTAKKTLNTIFKQSLEQNCDRFGTKLHSLAHYIRDKYLDAEKLLIEDQLTSEKVLLWQCLNTFIKSNEGLFIKLADKNFAKTMESSQQMNHSLRHGSNEDDATIAAEEWANLSLHENNLPSNDDNLIADYLLPELPHLCQYLQRFIQIIESENIPDEELKEKAFIYNHIVNIFLLYDICDEAQHNYLLEMAHAIIHSPHLHVTFEDSISPLMKFIAKRIFKDPDSLLTFTSECTSKVYNMAAESSAEEAMKLRAPETNTQTDKTFDVDYARLTVEIEEYRDQLDKALTTQNYIVAQDIKNKLDELNQEREQIQILRMNQKNSQMPSQSQPQPTQPFNLNDHPNTLLKCLQIFEGALEHGKFEAASTLIFSHIDRIVLPGIINPDERIRKIAVKALGLSCLLSEVLFQQHCNLLLQVLKYDQEEVRIVALYSFFDSLCKHGIVPLLKKNKAAADMSRRSSRKKIEEDIANLSLDPNDHDMEEFHSLMEEADQSSPEEEEEEQNNRSVVEAERSRFFETLNKTSEQEIIDSLINLFTERLYNCGTEIIEQTAIEGFAKLMILGVIYSPPLLSRLIIIWYLPETRANTLQFLGTFLPIYVGSESKYVREDDHITVTGQTSLADCFVDTLQVIFEAKHSFGKELEDLRLYEYLPSISEDSQYRQIDLKNLMNFMLNLIRPAYHSHLMANIIHKMFAIVKSPENTYKTYEDFLIEYLLKAALQISVTATDDVICQELRPVMNEIISKMKKREKILGAISKKKAQKFLHHFQTMCRQIQKGSEANTSMASSSEADHQMNVGDAGQPQQETQADEMNLDNLESMNGSSDDSKENVEKGNQDGEDPEQDDDGEYETADDGNDDIDSLSNVSQTLLWSDREDD